MHARTGTHTHTQYTKFQKKLYPAIYLLGLSYVHVHSLQPAIAVELQYEVVTFFFENADGNK